MTPVI